MNCFFSLIKFSVPNHGTDIPNHGTAIPNHGTDIPNYGTDIPNYGTEISAHYFFFFFIGFISPRFMNVRHSSSILTRRSFMTAK